MNACKNDNEDAAWGGAACTSFTVSSREEELALLALPPEGVSRLHYQDWLVQKPLDKPLEEVSLG